MLDLASLVWRDLKRLTPGASGVCWPSAPTGVVPASGRASAEVLSALLRSGGGSGEPKPPDRAELTAGAGACWWVCCCVPRLCCVAAQRARLQRAGSDRICDTGSESCRRSSHIVMQQSARLNIRAPATWARLSLSRTCWPCAPGCATAQWRPPWPTAAPNAQRCCSRLRRRSRLPLPLQLPRPWRGSPPLATGPACTGSRG